MSNRKAGELTKYLAALSHLGFRKDDERVVRVINEIEKELELNIIKQIAKNPNKALVVAIKDVSSSIGIWENYLFNEYYQLALREIKNKYSDVKEIFIAHHTEATEVNKEDFLKIGSQLGGTIVSSAIRKLKEYLDTDREIIVIQFSDGDNLTSDNARVIKHLNEEILPKVKYYKYFEADQYNKMRKLSDTVYCKINDPKLSYIVAKEKDHSLKGLRFGEELDNLN